MSDDDDESVVDFLKKRVAKMMRTNGYTEHEINARGNAIEFLYISFLKAGKNHWLSKQIPYLLKPDTMSNDEWIDYLDINWKMPALYSDSEVSDFN